jgi:transcriptional regulator with XRE-family HTH domain
MNFGETVRSVREEKGLSLTSLAKNLGVTKVYVSDVERGRRAPFNLTRIMQVSEFLGCDPFDLYVLAVRSRGHVVLPTADISDEHNRLAAVLSYNWGELNNDDVKRLIGAL